MRLIPLLVVAAAVLAACDAKRVERDARDPNYTYVGDEDAAMNAAMARAKATFSDFVTALRSGNPAYRDFAVKKPYATPAGGGEHMWIENIREVAGGFEGTIANDANDTRLVKYGDTVRFTPAEITDWKYVDGDLLVGGYTIRYFVERMSPEEKAALEKEAGFRVR
ncbi:MAG: DUF2314 domain-containing protein [Longimicrobiaceae bacterium]